MTDSLRARVIGGASWSTLTQVVVTSVQLASGVVLARVLSPDAFGLLGMALTVIALGDLLANLGLNLSLVQRRHLTERHIRSAFTAAGLVGVCLAIILLALAPILAQELGDNRASLILRFLSVVPIVSGLQAVSSALLSRRMDFRAIFQISAVSTTLAAFMTVMLAIVGAGVWSLVVGQIVQRAISLILTYERVRHSIVPLLSAREIRDLVVPSSGMTFSAFFSYVALQGDNFVVGRVLGTAALGLYGRAYSLMFVSTQQFVNLLTPVLLPAAAKIQNEPERFKKAFLKSLGVLNLVTLTPIAILILMSREIIVGVYGKQWIDAAAPLQILALGGLLRVTYNGAAAFLYAKGLVFQVLACQVVYGILVLAGTWLAARQWGLNGVAMAVAGAIATVWLLLVVAAGRAARASLAEVATALSAGAVLMTPAVLAAAGVKAVLGQTALSAPLMVLTLCGAAAAASWLVALFLVPQAWLMHLPHAVLLSQRERIPKSLYKTFAWAEARLSQVEERP